MAKRSAAMRFHVPDATVCNNMPAPSAWAWHPPSFPVAWPCIGISEGGDGTGMRRVATLRVRWVRGLLEAA